MKNLFFGLAVAVVALGASAFTNAHSTSTIKNGIVFANFGFTGTDVTNAQDYSAGIPSDCGALETVCQVSAPATGSGQINLNAIVPGFTPTTTVLDRINAALSTSPLTPNETVLSFRAE